MVRSTLSPNTKSVKMHESFRMETSCRARASNPGAPAMSGPLRGRVDDDENAERAEHAELTQRVGEQRRWMERKAR
jgi:hypothetical protein